LKLFQKLLKEEESIKEGVYVPDGIVPVCQGGCLIQEGADNIDINTEIIDGIDIGKFSISLESDLKITQRISETFSICPAQFEIISKALGKRFGIHRTFGFETQSQVTCQRYIQPCVGVKE
jgi:hypothetical protein